MVIGKGHLLLIIPQITMGRIVMCCDCLIDI